MLLRNVVKVEDVENKSRLKFRKTRIQTGDFLSIWKNKVTEYTGSSANFFYTTEEKRITVTIVTEYKFVNWGSQGELEETSDSDLA